ncbi:MAG: YqaA family protein [Rickettsiales bacterium]
MIFRSLSARAVVLTRHKSAELWLAGLAFIESFFFPVPADVMFVPMVLAAPARAYRLAAVATVASCVGGAFGYALGLWGYENIALPILEATGKVDEANRYRNMTAESVWTLWGLLLSSGFTHVPPIKVVTILSGASGVNFAFFMASAVLSRGARFYLLAWLLKKYGERIKATLEKRAKWIAIIMAATLTALVAFFLWKHA